MDLKQMSDEDLEDLYHRVEGERATRRMVKEAPQRAAEIEIRAVQELDYIASGFHSGDGGIGTPDVPREWKKPTGAHDAWPMGSVVVCPHGEIFRSTKHANDTDPCDEANYRWWQRLDAETGEPPAPEVDEVTGMMVWSGLGVPYGVGDERAYESVPYRCRQAHTSQLDWTPDAVPALWDRFEMPTPPEPEEPEEPEPDPDPEPEPEPDPEEPEPEPEPDPEPDPEPEHPEGYVGPWSKDATYKVGDVVDRNGEYYRCKVAHGPEYQGTWGPPQGSVWDDLGPAPSPA